MPIDPFTHLKERCERLIVRFLDPAIAAEAAALAAGDPMPQHDFDDFAAFRLLTHAELEGYYEAKAKASLDVLDAKFRSGSALTADFSALIFLYLWKERQQLNWPSTPDRDPGYIKALAQEAIGFGRQFVAANNGVKEASMRTLSALMGYFPDELDEVLISELNQYGSKRGDVAHSSWAFNTRTFESADIEKNRLVNILTLTKAFYE